MKEEKREEREVPSAVELASMDRFEKMARLLSPEREVKVSEDVAFNQLSIFIDYYKIRIENLAISEGPVVGETILNKLIQAIQEGRLEITEEDGLKVKQVLENSNINKELHYAILTNRHKIQMANDKNDMKNMVAFVSALTNVPVKEINNIIGADAGTMSALATLFTLV